MNRLKGLGKASSVIATREAPVNPDFVACYCSHAKGQHTGKRCKAPHPIVAGAYCDCKRFAPAPSVEECRKALREEEARKKACDAALELPQKQARAVFHNVEPVLNEIRAYLSKRHVVLLGGTAPYRDDDVVLHTLGELVLFRIAQGRFDG
jgi:hypothetical protein